MKSEKSKTKGASRQEIINKMIEHITNNSKDSKIIPSQMAACDVCLDVINMLEASTEEIAAAKEKIKTK